MRKFFFLALSLSVTFLSAAQDNLPPVFEIATDTAEYIRVSDSCWQTLKDKTGKLTIDQVSQPSFTDQFHTDTFSERGIHVYWFRCRLKNAMSHKVEIAILEDVSYGDVYFQDTTGRHDYKRNGFDVPWKREVN